MSSIRKPRFKESRRLGLNVCGHPKAMDRANKFNARDSKKLSDYGQQLLEKQRLKAYYGVREKQMVNYAKKSKKSKEQFSIALIQALETRLDNMVYRAGFAKSIRQARQMVVHNHILVNGKKVNIPSFKVRPGDQLSLKEKSQSIDIFTNNFKENLINSFPYIEKNEDSYSVKLITEPEREDIPIEINDQLVVEFYSAIE